MAIAPKSIDAAYYNPAGLAGLDDGLYLDLGYQIMAKTVKYEMARMSGEDTEPSWFIPQFAAAYKKGSGRHFPFAVHARGDRTRALQQDEGRHAARVVLCPGP